MVGAVTNVSAFLGGIVVASAIFMIVWLFATWWHSRKRDRAILASQAEMVQSLDDEDQAEPTKVIDVHLRKRMRILSDRQELIDRFMAGQVTIILDGDSLLMVDVDVKEAKRPKTAWEQEMDDTQELSGVRPLKREVEEPLSGRAA